MPPLTIDWRRIGAAHPEPQIRSTSILGEEWTSYSFLVNGSLVFRFPKRPEGGPELEREIAFLAAAADLCRCPCLGMRESFARRMPLPMAMLCIITNGLADIPTPPL